MIPGTKKPGMKISPIAIRKPVISYLMFYNEYLQMYNLFSKLGLLVLTLIFFGCISESNLDYSAKYIVHDAPHFSKKNYDDTEWNNYDELGSLSVKKKIPYYYWIRINLPESFNYLKDPAISLGYIGDVEEVYLNGKYIGQTGNLTGKTKQFYHYPRLYRLPKDYLEENNVISIRAKKITVMTAGIYNGKIQVDEHKRMLDKVNTSFFWIKDLGLLLAFFCLMMGLYHLFLYFKIPKHKHNFIYFIFSVFSSLMCFSLSWGFTNFITSAIWVIKVHSLIAIGTCLSYFTFFLYFLNIENKKKYKYLYFINLAVIIAILLINDLTTVFNIFNCWYMIAFLMVVYAVWLLCKKYRETKTIYLQYLIGSLFVLITCIFADILHGLGLGLYFQISGIGFFALNIGLMITLAQDFTEAYLDQEMVVAQRTSDLQLVIGELKEMEANKEVFFSNITHDLKTPITVVMSALEKIKGGIKEEAINTVDTALSTVSNLNRMVVDILDTAKAADGKLDIQFNSVDPEDFFNSLFEEYELLASGKRLNFAKSYTSKDDGNIITDQSKLKRVLDNLFSNAVKYTKNGDVGINVNIDDEKIIIRVEDSGQGIPIQERDKVFDRYYQLENNRAGGQGSVGIGLSYVKKVIDELNGNITITDSDLGGVCFRIELPHQKGITDQQLSTHTEVKNNLGIEVKTEYPDKLPASLDHQKSTILAVEDTPEIALTIHRALKEDYNLYMAENGEEALTVLEDRKIDLIISDVMMPIMDGKQLLIKIKAKNRLKTIPFLFLTSLGDQKHELELLDLGAQDHIVKPFTTKSLKARIKTNIENVRLKNELATMDKQTSVGLLSAAISHEIKNPIHASSNIVRSSSDIVEKIYALWEMKDLEALDNYMKAAKEPISNGLGSALKSIERINEIITNMSMPVIQKEDVKRIILKEYIDECIAGLKTKLTKKRIKIDFDISSNEISVTGHTSLFQVFNNIIDNAVSAISHEQGLIKITMSDLNDEEVLIKIQDNGQGIDEEVLPQIFEPLFTTKANGKGSGFGLYLTRNIIENHSSSIQVESRIGKGTTFIILLQKKPDFSRRKMVKYKGVEV
jgi:signal transduction histidine kinase